MDSLKGITFENGKELRQELSKIPNLRMHEMAFIADKAKYYPMFVSDQSLATIRARNHFPEHIFEPLLDIEFESYDHKWQLVDRLSNISEIWRYKPRRIVNDFHNRELDKMYELLYRMFVDD